MSANQNWWNTLARPRTAAGVLLERSSHFTLERQILLFIFAFYAAYGVSMGLYRSELGLGTWAGFAPVFFSALKLPLLFLLTLVVCFPGFYVLNCLAGPRLHARGVMRLVLLGLGANAVAIGSFVPVAMFFTLTTTRDSYVFLVLLHVAAFAAAGAMSVVVIGLMFRGAATALGARLSLGFIGGWCIVYFFVTSQMSWVLRPWLGSWDVPYTPLRPIESSFFEAIWRLIN